MAGEMEIYKKPTYFFDNHNTFFWVSWKELHGLGYPWLLKCSSVHLWFHSNAHAKASWILMPWVTVATCSYLGDFHQVWQRQVYLIPLAPQAHFTHSFTRNLWYPGLVFCFLSSSFPSLYTPAILAIAYLNSCLLSWFVCLYSFIFF